MSPWANVAGGCYLIIIIPDVPRAPVAHTYEPKNRVKIWINDFFFFFYNNLPRVRTCLWIIRRSCKISCLMRLFLECSGKHCAAAAVSLECVQTVRITGISDYIRAHYYCLFVGWLYFYTLFLILPKIVIESWRRTSGVCTVSWSVQSKITVSLYWTNE